MGQDLNQLLGGEVSAICFVRDYTEIHFDGPILRALVEPRCVVGSETYTSFQAGLRDALCTFIGQKVESVDVDPLQYIRCTFGTTDLIELSLARTDPYSGESAHFVPGENLPIEVF